MESGISSDQLHQVVASIDQAQGLVNYAPHDPVFSMRNGDDPRPISQLVAAFDRARRGDLSGWSTSL